MVSGEAFAVNCGTTMMPVLSANSWDTLLMVIYVHIVLCTHRFKIHAAILPCTCVWLQDLHIIVQYAHASVQYVHASAAFTCSCNSHACVLLHDAVFQYQI